ncbi:MAG: alpha/beta hydrolase [Cyclobacteriaceae bacterium]
MKTYFITLLVSILLGSLDCYGQEQIPYGSNNGKYVSIFDKKIYYEEYGTGMPVILLEGGLKSIKDFSLCIPELAKHFRVIAPDDPGQGRSEALDTMTYDLLAQYVIKLVDHLKVDSAYVMGWSDGGIAALILAAKRPDIVKRIIAVGANYTKSGYVSSDSVKGPLQLLPPDYQPEPESQKWVDEYFSAMNKKNWRKTINERMVMWDQAYCFPEELLGEIKIPVMIVAGDRDVIKIDHTVEMHQLIKGSELCILPDTSHDVFGERPKLISDIATNFFGTQY